MKCDICDKKLGKCTIDYNCAKKHWRPYFEKESHNFWFPDDEMKTCMSCGLSYISWLKLNIKDKLAFIEQFLKLKL
jgi:hypothetical protein